MSDVIFMHGLVRKKSLIVSTGKREYCMYILSHGDGGARFPAHQLFMETPILNVEVSSCCSIAIWVGIPFPALLLSIPPIVSAVCSVLL